MERIGESSTQTAGRLPCNSVQMQHWGSRVSDTDGLRINTGALDRWLGLEVAYLLIETESVEPDKYTASNLFGTFLDSTIPTRLWLPPVIMSLIVRRQHGALKPAPTHLQGCKLWTLEPAEQKPRLTIPPTSINRLRPLKLEQDKKKMTATIR